MKFRRALATLSVLVAAGVVPLVTAGTAQADPFDCVDYLKSKNYEIGPKVTKACSYNKTFTNWKCVAQLSLLMSNTSHIANACSRAIGD
ncbi:hypothetical protein O3Q52_21840 [Streptomyces sp. ActVer]|uniref:hypothetical protein n=1 Tax=Streptomyces sp. ActVer TaxID=3014558 RepID=UPI0022B41797|nr:hypothetical protein [Streptomyces sp. ActVer]MCZ4510783.1 hypothetical protein [Streptomyces sp. ActVer]